MECPRCQKTISQEEWDSFGGMCASCENQIFDCAKEASEEEY